MTITFPYLELSSIIKSKFGYEVSFIHLADMPESSLSVNTTVGKTVSILGYEKTISKKLSINLTEVKINGTDLSLHYDAGLALNLILPKITSHIPSSFIEDKVVEFDNDYNVTVHLNKIEKLQEVLKYISIDEIAFRDDEATVYFKLREESL